MKFSGFPRGTQYTPVPNPLLGPLLENIDDLAELKCTLRALWHIHQRGRHKGGQTRHVTAHELLSDRALLTGLQGLGVLPREAIRRGMEKGVERGTFISLAVTKAGSLEEVYLLNDEPGRRASQMIKRGELDIKGDVSTDGIGDELPEPKANIFTLYEDNIGMLTPLLAEQISEAEGSYPWSWIEEAFKIAVGNNKRSWRYIEATLRRWAAEGKDDGESGRYPQKAPSTEHLVEYLRKRGRLPGS